MQMGKRALPFFQDIALFVESDVANTDEPHRITWSDSSKPKEPKWGERLNSPHARLAGAQVLRTSAEIRVMPSG